MELEFSIREPYVRFNIFPFIFRRVGFTESYKKIEG